MERPLLKYASTANARCSHVQSMIGTGCGGTKIEGLPSRAHPLPAPYLSHLPFGGFFKKVSFSVAPCTCRLYEVSSEKSRNFSISRVWRVLLSIFFIMLVYTPLKYDKIFSCIHCLLWLWQPLRLDAFL